MSTSPSSPGSCGPWCIGLVSRAFFMFGGWVRLVRKTLWSSFMHFTNICGTTVLSFKNKTKTLGSSAFYNSFWFQFVVSLALYPQVPRLSFLTGINYAFLIKLIWEGISYQQPKEPWPRQETRRKTKVYRKVTKNYFLTDI